MNNENLEPCCDGQHPHRHIKKDILPPEDTLYGLADLFKTFGDPTRIRILYTLAAGELCVCDIAETLSMTQSAISHQLRVLKQMSLVRFRRDGKTIYYSLADGHVETILAQGLAHINE
jgi:Predicted transcriptional regulators